MTAILRQVIKRCNSDRIGNDGTDLTCKVHAKCSELSLHGVWQVGPARKQRLGVVGVPPPCAMNRQAVVGHHHIANAGAVRPRANTIRRMVNARDDKLATAEISLQGVASSKPGNAAPAERRASLRARAHGRIAVADGK
jgi:hypothetical protein